MPKERQYRLALKAVLTEVTVKTGQPCKENYSPCNMPVIAGVSDE